VIDKQKSQTVGAAFVLLQGVVTALFPQISIKIIKMTIGKNFDNASALEAKPRYVRQLRAIGVGMVAAAGTDLLLQSTGKTDDEPVEADDDGDSADDGDHQ
jgi:hypothetical protein